MSVIVIQELLGTDPFSGSRIVINANFQSLKTELEALENNLGISVASGNIDVSAATGGQIKAKVGAFDNIQLPSTGIPNITLTGATGAMVGKTLSLATSATIPTLGVDNFTASSLGNSTFNGIATFNALTKINDGIALNKISLTSSEHTVINDDCVLVITLSVGSPGALILTPDPSLVDGHVVTIVDASSNVGTILDTTYIMGFALGSITFASDAYKSCITLMWSVANTKWIIIGSSNMTIV
jgi:hypothetical protein